MNKTNHSKTNCTNTTAEDQLDW